MRGEGKDQVDAPRVRGRTFGTFLTAYEDCNCMIDERKKERKGQPA